jgi:hypothetical protein
MSKNYGETLAYWYLRLNGFFPLPDFVLYRLAEDRANPHDRSSDCDIVAIRPPFVYERIGGMDVDWDRDFWTAQDIPCGEGTIALIAEVKTSPQIGLADLSFLEAWNLRYAVERCGVVFPRHLEAVAEDLQNRRSLQYNGEVFIMKLAITESRHRFFDEAPCYHLTLNHIEQFIVQRFERYRAKYADRLAFPSELIQYLAWKTRHQP